MDPLSALPPAQEVRGELDSVCTCKTGTRLPCLAGNREDSHTKEREVTVTKSRGTYFELRQKVGQQVDAAVDMNTIPSGTEFRAGGSGHSHNR